jgi:nitrate reductase beta subunit
VPVAVENFHALKNRQTADRPSTPGRVNLLNWDGNGTPPSGMFPPKAEGE